MRTQRLCLLAAIVLALFMTTGSYAQETPESPESPEAPTAAEPETSPEAEAAPEPAAEPEPAGPASLVYESTVDFEALKRITLDARVGEVEIRAVEFTTAASKGGVFGTSDADLKATIGVRLDCFTAAEKKWKIDLTIQFLNGQGDLIDRVKHNASLKDEQKMVEISHTTLKFVVPQIEKVKISAVAKGKK